MKGAFEERVKTETKAYIQSYGSTKARQFAGLKRVIFVMQLTVIEHNFGYVANSFIEYMGLSSTSYGVLANKRIDIRKVTPRKTIKSNTKAAATPGPDYMPGNF